MSRKLTKQEIKELSYRNKNKRRMLSLFSELRSAKNTMMIFKIILSTTGWLLISLILARFFLINPLYLSWMPLLSFIFGIRKMIFTDALKKAEKQNRAFNEQLSTARDNFEKENEMIDQLEEDILMRAKLLSSSSYFERKPVVINVILICALIFISSAISAYDVRDLPRILKPVVDVSEDVLPRTLPWLQRISMTGSEGAGDIESTDDIYGDASEFIDGKSEIPIELQSARDSLDLSTIKEFETTEFDTYSPSNLKVEGAETYENTIPLEKYNVVRNYFTND